jgi:hypothetical protein
MTSLLMLGFVMGLRHALEADHLAAIASLSTRHEGLAGSLRRGGAWGLGHTTTLLAMAAAYWWLGIRLPPSASRGLEAAVGLMLVVLGLDVVRRMRRGRIHVHVHSHGHDVVHVHAHRHPGTLPHERDPHDHAHPATISARAFLVGMMHGMAGSAALLLLTLQMVSSPLAGLLYVATFGVGSIAGMAAASAAITFPLRQRAAGLNQMLPAYEAVVAVMTFVSGCWVLFSSLSGG